MRFRTASSPLFALLVLSACGPSGPPASSQAPSAKAPAPSLPPGEAAAAAPAPARPRPGAIFAPFPYTAEEIRASSPAGRVCVMRIVDPNGEMLTRMEFSEPDAEGVIVKTSATSSTGESMGESAERSSWEDLVRHASYPFGFTTITQVEVSVAAGTFQAKLYEVAGSDGAVEKRAWFADGLAGPPVKMEELQAGQVMLSVELVESTIPGAQG